MMTPEKSYVTTSRREFLELCPLFTAAYSEAQGVRLEITKDGIMLTIKADMKIILDKVPLKGITP